MCKLLSMVPSLGQALRAIEDCCHLHPPPHLSITLLCRQGEKFLWCTGWLLDMQRPAEMPASVSGQLLTGIELTLVLTPPEESEGHKSEKK